MFNLALKNLKDKIGKTIGMIVAIMISIVVLFCIFSFNGAVNDYLVKTDSADSGISDITITPKSDGAKISSTAELENVEGISFAVGTLNFYGEAKGEYLSIVGMDSDDFLKLNKFDILEGSIEDLQGSRENIAISVAMAKNANVKLGDELEISVFNRSNKFYVAAICENTGYFASDSPYKVLGHNAGGMARLIGVSVGGICNRIYVKAESGYSVDKLIKNIKAVETYSNMTVKQSLDLEYVAQQSESYSATVIIGGVAVAVLLVGALVVLQTLSAEEKRVLISKLTTVGATKKQLVSLFALENGFVALVGLILGLCLAPLGLYLLLKLTISSAVFGVNALYLILSGILVFAISFGAGFIPYFMARKKSSRENLVLQKNQKNVATVISAAVSALLVVLNLLVMALTPMPTVRGVFGLLNVAMIAICACLIAPLILKGISKGLSRSKNPDVYVAAKGLENKSTRRGARLLTLGVTVGVLLTLAWTVTKAVFSNFKDDYADLIFVTNVSSTATDFDDISAVKGVEKASKALWLKGDAEFKGLKKSVNVIAVDDVFDIIDFRFITDKKTCSEKLNEGYCLIDYAYSVLHGLNVGDSVKLKYEDKTATFTVGGIVRQELFGGAYLVVGRQTLSSALNTSCFDTIVVSAKNADAVAKKMQTEFSSKNLFVLTALKTFSWESESFDKIFNLIGYLSIMFLLAMMASVIVNVFIARGTKKNERSQLMLLGMQKKDMLLSEWLEHTIVAAVAFVIAVAFSALHILSLIYALLLFELYFEFYYVAWVTFTVSGVVCLIYSLLPFILCFSRGYKIKGVSKE